MRSTRSRCIAVCDIRPPVICATAFPTRALCSANDSTSSQRRLDARLELFALGLLLVVGDASLWGALVLPTLLRIGLQIAVVVHELGHAILAGAGVQSSRARSVFAHAALPLLPLRPIYIPGLDDPRLSLQLDVGGLSALHRRAAALGGPGANLIVLALLAPVHAADPQPLVSALMLTNLWVLLTSWTDYRCLLFGDAVRLYCGNFGILAKRERHEHGFLPRRFRRLTERLGHATDVRGQQAGGLAVMSATGRFVGRKIVNDKRGDLTRDLIGSFRRRALLRRIAGARPMAGIFHLIGHYRYGTSSAPSIIETHWHRWLAPRRERLWLVDGRRLVRRRRVVETLITHNGDFLGFRAPWATRPVSELGGWLAQILGERNAARGDSPKIAGMLDLLCTQGRWEASLRLAFAMQTGRAAPRGYLKELTHAAEQVFERWVQTMGATGTRDSEGQSDATDLGRPLLTVVGCASLAEVHAANRAALPALLDALWQASLQVSRQLEEDAKPDARQMLEDALEAFFLNDVYRATRHFMEHAEGTFGLVATTSLQPGAVVLACERQPLFIGADPDRGLLVYASEAAALKVAGEPKDADRVAPIPFRCDLRDGDIALLQVNEDTADNSITLLNRHRDDAPAIERITAHGLAASARDDGGAVAGVIGPQPIQWIGLIDNPLVTAGAGRLGRRRRDDAVLTEMREIPAALERVLCAWDDPGSPNRRTAAALTAALLHGGPARSEEVQPAGAVARSPSLDLLLLGVENNLYLAERFVGDLQRVLPRLRLKAVDAVAYCEDPQEYDVGPETITLALSHSGQTFNTLDAVKFVQALHRLGKAGPVFVMTGEIDTLMGAAVGQSVRAGALWQARVFDTRAGWCVAEPATLSTAAMQATLTQLLLHIMREAAMAEGARPFGLTARAEDIEQVDAMARLSVSRAASLVGCTAEGWQVRTGEHDALARQGRSLARMLTEPALVFLLAATHLFAMLWLGWNPVMGLQDLLGALSPLAVFDASTTEGKMLRVVFETAYFLFAGVVFTLALRWLQERPLWDRVFVGRTLVIGDEPWVKNLLSQFVSKLFSLAYEFAGFAAIHAADARSSDLLHTYGHRITRGLILFLGMPDGRWEGRGRAEDAVCMTSCQVRGVQNLGSGAMVIGVGHNPACADKIDRFMLLGSEADRSEVLPWVLRGHWTALARKLQESRFASFERLLASYVVFHSAAAHTRDFMNYLAPVANLVWLPVFLLVKLLTGGRVRPRFGRWDLARTQSGTRIATTAAPVSAYDKDPRDYQPPSERYLELARRDASELHLAPAPAPMGAARLVVCPDARAGPKPPLMVV